MTTPVSHEHTDCRSDTGITVGLIDSLITIARVLAGHNLDAPAVREALRDLAGDEDIRRILVAAHSTYTISPPSVSHDPTFDVSEMAREIAAILRGRGRS